MNRIVCLLSLLLLSARAFCAAPSILVTVSDFTLDYSAPNRVVRIIPTAATGGTARRGLSDSSGQVTFTSVTPGLWTLTIESVGVPALTLRVPSSSDTLSASNLVVSAWTPPTPGNSAQASANLAAWSLLSTSAKQDILAASSAITGSNATLNGWLNLSGKTNRVTDSGTQLLYNGSPIGSAAVWTNDAGVVHLPSETNQNLVSVKTSLGGTNAAGQITLSTFTDSSANVTIQGDTGSIVSYAYGGVATTVMSAEGSDLTILDPTRDWGGAAPYLFDTSATLSSNSLALFRNHGTNIAALDYTGALNLSGKTNKIGDNGTAITYNGTAVGGGDQVWTNDNEVLYPNHTNAQVVVGRTTADTSSLLTAVPAAENLHFSLSAGNHSVFVATNQPLYRYPNPTVGIRGYSTSSSTNGANIGVLGEVIGRAAINAGVVGSAFNDLSTAADYLLAGVYGGTVTYDSPGIYAALVGEIISDETSDAKLTPESAVALLDNRTSGLPLIVARTNNGTTVFEVGADGTITFADGTTQSTAAKAGANTYATYAAGTAYSLTTTYTNLDFGTTDPTITIATAGTYLIHANVGVKYTGLTYVAAQTATLKVRRTNNTATDVTNAARTVEMPVLTTFTGGDVFALPTVIYTAAAGDVLALYGNLSGSPGAGTVNADSAEIVAVRLQ